jgi:hypothetical protein
MRFNKIEKHEIITNKNEYPNLFELLVAQNKYDLETHEKKTGYELEQSGNI